VATPIVAEPTAAPLTDTVAFRYGADAVLAEQEDILTDLSAETDAASQESTWAGIQAHGPALRALQRRWLATGDSMDELRPVPPEMQEVFALWVQAYSEGAQALDSIAEGAETLNPTLVDDGHTHLTRAKELFNEAAEALPRTTD
jgi:hypothetical protein